MRPNRFDPGSPTSVKVDLVLRLLGGEELGDVAREAGRQPRQLSAWRDRFLEGGEACLDGHRDRSDVVRLRGERDALAADVEKLKAENRLLDRRVELNTRMRGGGVSPHPNCSLAYAQACSTSGVRPFHVPEWGAYVLIRDGHGGACFATGVRPQASLDPDSDLSAGLARLRQAGVVSVSLVPDPLWSPTLGAFRRAFEICQPLKIHFMLDRGARRVQIGKRHRNRINQALRACEIREGSLAEHVPRWMELYRWHVANRRIAHPFGVSYFETLAQLDGLKTLIVTVNEEIVNMTLWLRHEDVLYFYDGASNAAGLERSASYAAFAYVIETESECRYLFFGGPAEMRANGDDGLTAFKRGFANAFGSTYLCSTAFNLNHQ
jgi:hypothetical protein